MKGSGGWLQDASGLVDGCSGAVFGLLVDCCLRPVLWIGTSWLLGNVTGRQESVSYALSV